MDMAFDQFTFFGSLMREHEGSLNKCFRGTVIGSIWRTGNLRCLLYERVGGAIKLLRVYNSGSLFFGQTLRCEGRYVSPFLRFGRMLRRMSGRFSR